MNEDNFFFKLKKIFPWVTLRTYYATAQTFISVIQKIKIIKKFLCIKETFIWPYSNAQISLIQRKNVWIKETFFYPTVIVKYTVKEKISLNWRKFFWFKTIFFNVKNLFLWIKENFFELTKLSSIKKNFFFDRISKKCFFDSKKLFSHCTFSAFFKWKKLFF